MALVIMGGAQGGPPIRGQLARGDRTLRTGEYYIEYTFDWRAGQNVVVDLSSTAFDPYLIIVAPSGDKKENDDWQDSKSRSRVEWPLTESGEYRLIITSYEKGETGAYELRVTASAAAATSAAEPGVRTESGRLASGDRAMKTGEYYDEFTFQARRGDAVTVDLRSTQFDPYVILITPAGKQIENDDYEGDSQRSFVSLDITEEGTYKVWVTSYEKGETGNYDLRIALGGPAAAAAGPRLERGRLASGDETLRSGEFVDAYTFEGRPGQRVTLDVSSRDFDTYLILIPPRGDRHENDDVEDKPGHSVIEADLSEAGTYRVLITSYEKGESGNYELRIDVGAMPVAAAGTTGRDLVAIDYGQTRDGQLSNADGRLTNGEYRDVFAFDGKQGDQIVIELVSKEFDPYLLLLPPQGEQIDNDDADGRQDLSRIELTLPASGRYRIMATSYETGETGGYRLTLRRGAATRPTPAATTGGDGRVFGVFVGISNYGGRANNLMYTADDARRIQQAMTRGGRMRQADSTLLLNEQATLANVRDAVAGVARQIGPNDTFMFFFSGHGSRVPRGTSQAADPDGEDETVEFYDRGLTDDDMNTWLNGIRGKVSLIVLDSCFSGGFSKDIISAPGRMGLFSSEEDVTSGVAAKFRAGGYLSQFVAEAVGDGQADADGNGLITALEISQVRPRAVSLRREVRRRRRQLRAHGRSADRLPAPRRRSRQHRAVPGAVPEVEPRQHAGHADEMKVMKNLIGRSFDWNAP